MLVTSSLLAHLLPESFVLNFCIEHRNGTLPNKTSTDTRKCFCGAVKGAVGRGGGGGLVNLFIKLIVAYLRTGIALSEVNEHKHR
jgi:hypothetical protein